MRLRLVLTSILAAAVGLGGGCGGSDVTAARVVVTLAAGVQADQLRVEVLVAGVPLTSADVPRQPGGAVPSGTDLVVRFPDSLANQEVTFLVGSFAAAAQTGRGEGSATLKMAQTVTVPVTLEAAACPANQHQCTGGCYPDADVTHCGLACLSCPVPAGHGAAACTAGMCAVTCDAGYVACDAACSNLTNDPDHCGTCASACATDEVCAGGVCQPNPCPAGKHLCGAECVTDLDLAHCGRSCEPCPTPANGTATCDGTQCSASCHGGYHACGSQCVSNTSPATCGTRCTPCPTPANGTATCGDGTCGVACNGGYHACGGDCVGNNDAAHCGASCTPCPAPANGTATCASGTCGVVCNSGFKPCQGSCVPTGQSCQATWTQRVTASGPQGRTRPGMAYDVGRHVTVLFGGWNGTTALNDTWEWNGTTWNVRSPATSPTARSAVAMAYDATRGRVVLFGGESTSLGTLGDTWTWNGTTWTDTQETGPEARSFASAVWDSDFQEVVLFGGWNGSTALADVWAWDGAQWTERAPGGGSPGGRANFGMVYDAAHSGMVVVFGGGTDNGGNGLLGDTWLLAANLWGSPALTPVPSARAGMAFAYDTDRGLGVLFGGFGTGTSYLGDTWSWSTGWATLATSGSPPARWRGGMVYDSARGVMVLFGGAAPPSTYFSDTWELSW